MISLRFKLPRIEWFKLIIIYERCCYSDTLAASVTEAHIHFFFKSRSPWSSIRPNTPSPESFPLKYLQLKKRERENQFVEDLYGILCVVYKNANIQLHWIDAELYDNRLYSSISVQLIFRLWDVSHFQCGIDTTAGFGTKFERGKQVDYESKPRQFIWLQRNSVYSENGLFVVQKPFDIFHNYLFITFFGSFVRQSDSRILSTLPDEKTAHTKAEIDICSMALPLPLPCGFFYRYFIDCAHILYMFRALLIHDILNLLKIIHINYPFFTSIKCYLPFFGLRLFFGSLLLPLLLINHSVLLDFRFDIMFDTQSHWSFEKDKKKRFWNRLNIKECGSAFWSKAIAPPGLPTPIDNSAIIIHIK